MAKGKISGFIAIAAVVTLMGSAQAGAQEACVSGACAKLPEVRYESPDQIPAVIGEVLQRAEFLEKALSDGLSAIRNSGEDRRRLTRQALESQREKEAQERRRQSLMRIVVFDENYDGFVTAEEIETSLRREQLHGSDASRLMQRRDEMMRADADGDGRISLREAAESANSNMNNARYMSQSDRFENLLALDIDGDGALSDREMEALLRAGFAVLDKDGDGALSSDEKRPLQENIRRQQEFRQMQALAARCAMPKPAADEDVAFLGTQEGAAVSSASFASARNRRTSAVVISVSTLEKKKYLVLASMQPMVWDITGPVTHVTRVVLFGPSEGGSVLAGVRGVPKERVTMLSAECLPKMYQDMRDSSGQSPHATSAIEAYAGKRPAVAQTIDKLYEATLLGGGFITVRTPPPSAFETPAAGFDPDIWREKIVREKMGLRLIAAADVFSGAKLEQSATLPGSYGLAKLVHDGVIEKVPSGSFMRVYSTGGGNSVSIIESGGNDTVVVQGGGDMQRVPIYDYRLKRGVPSLPAVSLGIRKLLIPENIKVPDDIGLKECASQKGPAGERVFETGCRDR
ncbi:MAG TPA: hypothetical protein PLX33_11230 [Alphaproteobacteria bacterium]|nr:hypothetical protein [Alphaproteobacteria bacterium]